MARILLAEDDDDMRRFLVKALERAGYQVSDFDNGASAYERLREEPFSLLLTDIVMPEMDGIAMAKAAASLFPAMKILLMTGYADQRERAEELNGVIVDVVQKPFTLAEIRARVEQALACFA
ncbi:response regulator [Mesorhizobium sp. M6A.T.Ca.TU.002.02.2.1]|nr:response regulator [Mesorhizobium sp. M6A.T.Ca.TU.002.02.2.1]